MATSIYTDDLIDNLELRWGEGFLSAGGEDELAVLLSGIEIFDRTVLDIGCGIGGVDIHLVKKYGAKHVLGVDVEQSLVDRATVRATSAGLARRLDFRLIDSGFSPISSETFDIVFSKGSIVHIQDKDLLYGQAFRVLRPGGALVIGDLYRGQDNFTAQMELWLSGSGVTLFMETIEKAKNEILSAGFRRIRPRDRNSWFCGYCKDELARLKGHLWQRYVERFGVEGAEACVEGARLKWMLAEQGQLRPGHIHAWKPEQSYGSSD